jgi:hypothetical protein
MLQMGAWPSVLLVEVLVESHSWSRARVQIR